MDSSQYVTSALVFTASLVGTYFIVNRIRGNRDGRKYPPSIGTLPIIGSALYVPDFTEMHSFFLQKSYQLGDIVTFSIGSMYVVVLNSGEAMHDAFVTRAADFSDRPMPYMGRFLNPNYKGIVVAAYNSEFKKYHQMSLYILKQFGVGQSLMEERIRLEVEDLIERMRDLKGQPVDPRDLVYGSVLNVISGILFGRKYGHCGEKTKDILEAINDILRDGSKLVALDFLPALRFLPNFRRIRQRVSEATEKIARLAGETIDQVERGCAGVEDDGNYECFIEAYIKQEGKNYDREQLIFTVRDLVMGGTETSTTTIVWALVTLANEQDIQTRLHSEISGVASFDGHVSLSHKPRLPYTEAFTMELMRRRTVAPLAISHFTHCDTTVNGYFIPKNSMVIPNLYAAHMNTSVWSNPEEFKPERFLDETGSTVVNKDMTIPFSLGKRSCLGEFLARQELFLFITALVQNFQILPPEGQDKIHVTEQVTFVLTPSPFKVRLIPRK